jgi:aspartyl-tRNA(Asn)/glutamyl-tRNA(Gln) amidotransferase subunit C
MSTGFTREEIEALAVLAHLQLGDAEVERLGRELGAFLEYARQVQRIDTTGVPPTSSVSVSLERDREDRVQPSLDRAEALSNAPDAAVNAGFFRVPRVL